MSQPHKRFNTSTYIPEKSLVPTCRVDLKLHIYTRAEVLRIVEASKRFFTPILFKPHTYVTTIGLLWETRLRIGEIVRLNEEYVDI